MCCGASPQARYRTFIFYGPVTIFLDVSEDTRDTLHLGPGRILFQKDTYIFQKIPPFMTFRNSDGVRIHLATAK